MRIGVLTAGGDAPGLNAAIRAIGRSALADGHDVLGIKDGWAGLLDTFDPIALTRQQLAGTLPLGGTLLGSTRVNLDDPPGGRDKVLEAISTNLDALIAIGGDGTHQISSWLAERGGPVVGVPKTLDNDLVGTDYCIGFDTAVATVAEALDRLHTTAASHHRVMVVETMGRKTGWVAALGGLAGGADLIVIPEFEMSCDAIVDHLDARRRGGSTFSIVVVAEGVSLGALSPTDAQLVDPLDRVRLGERGVGHLVAAEIAAHSAYETRTTVLGHLQRGGSPSAHDRIYATRVGVGAYNLVQSGRFGTVCVVRGDEVTEAPLEEVTAGIRQVPESLYRLCATFF